MAAQGPSIIPVEEDRKQWEFLRFIVDGAYDSTDGKKPMVNCDLQADGSVYLNAKRGGPELIDDSLHPSGYSVIPRHLYEAWANHQITDQEFAHQAQVTGRNGACFHHTHTLPD